MKKPTRLFHLTRPANEASIREKGLLYYRDIPPHALTFSLIPLNREEVSA